MIARRDVLTLAGTTIATSASVSSAGAARTTQQSVNWSQFRFDAANTGSNLGVTGPQTASPRWVFETEGPVGSSPAVVPELNAVVIGSNDNHIYGINLDDGSEIGKVQLGGPVSSSPAVGHGAVFVGGMDRKVYAFSIEQGDVLWSNKFGLPFVSSPCVTDERVFIAGWDSRVYAFAPESGATLWSYDVTAPVFATPAASNDIVYVGDGGGTLHAISAAEGERQWTAELGDILHASPTVVEGTVYIGSLTGVEAYESDDRQADVNQKWEEASGGRYVALSSETGDVQWEVDTGNPVISSPAIAEETIYVGSEDETLLAVNRLNGELRWEYETNGPVRSSPAVGQEAVYVGGTNGNVYAVNRGDGTERWTFRTGNWVDSSPALIDGLVVVGSGDGKVYAISDEGTSAQSNQGGGSGGGSSERQRGFFSNSAEGEPAYLSNVFNLTVLGLLLSVAGIIYQMFEGG